MNYFTKRFKVGFVFFLTVFSICVTSPATLRAQDATNTDASKPAQQGQTLTDETLQKMLSDMGLEPKKLSKGFLLAIKQDTWTLNVQCVLSADKTKVGLNANLGMVADVESVTASQWMNLLIANGDIDPSNFYYDKDQKKLYLHRTFDNRDLTAAILRKQLDSFCANVRATEKLWNFTK